MLVVVPVAAVVAGVVAIQRALSTTGPLVPACRVMDGTTPYPLGVDQTANATTIAAVGKAMGLPDHAVTVALATALQESGLRNLDHGDLDSLGLFQQRPSQGWGTPAQIMTPTYAARTFYTHLVQVPNWESLPLTEAAQKVQRSAAPNAYALWEPEARTVAQAVTGEVACRADVPVRAAAGAGGQLGALAGGGRRARTARSRRGRPGGAGLDGRQLAGRTRLSVPPRRGLLPRPELDTGVGPVEAGQLGRPGRGRPLRTPARASDR